MVPADGTDAVITLIALVVAETSILLLILIARIEETEIGRDDAHDVANTRYII
jgi:hypothetical protein